ncbi:TIGR03619 family F420-dependent LLM class oxidoreductase [Frankia sp. CNm7]|uniref:TIGR03619 family F420-dependent LLM class oxidoreductase n=1 Tax=Frankia nepalensis TaxID=1836974 RepID=A0A937RCG7_9ACTN|nr:TIGR03619 family F420-dependent LLM class oxidoreductase [Frankia nepalensis]MBL7496402.1 TIGR03619 family F420-dependent LLM class oxidoreductase [Frankia nepalensis]MBL7511448.1 TIGR03619 family F420-dependent LLM class oxidoreductase [Frankia nepalensis]MBL7523591.1 TIGR03619 family F420-dependent LLM class oxidoreductase [Frankia nepalensis]MBL7627312.1 TIGR03619 family F420-dependent LLM class oxidoreductase [Frankia nepalensis]
MTATQPAAGPTARPRLALGLPVGESMYRSDEQHKIIDLARAADEAGVDTLVQSDHVIMGERLDRYPWGPFRYPYGSPWLEPVTLLSVIAGATARVRLSTGILIAGLRRAPLLAKQAATLDALSRGRLELGVGTGWQPEEYETLDLDFANRAQILDDTIAACRALWAPGPAAVDLPTARFEKIWCDPKPTQPNGPAILFSGPLTRRNLRRITELGDGWIPIMGETVEGVAAGLAKIREAWAAAGRGDETPRVRHSLPIARDDDGSLDLDRTLAGAPALADLGVTEVSVPISAFVRDGAEATAWIADLGQRWEKLWS